MGAAPASAAPGHSSQPEVGIESQQSCAQRQATPAGTMSFTGSSTIPGFFLPLSRAPQGHGLGNHNEEPTWSRTQKYLQLPALSQPWGWSRALRGHLLPHQAPLEPSPRTGQRQQLGRQRHLRPCPSPRRPGRCTGQQGQRDPISKSRPGAGCQVLAAQPAAQTSRQGECQVTERIPVGEQPREGMERPGRAE